MRFDSPDAVVAPVSLAGLTATARLHRFRSYRAPCTGRASVVAARRPATAAPAASLNQRGDAG